MMNGLLILLGLAALAYLVKAKQPGLVSLAGAFLAAGFNTTILVWKRRDDALHATGAARSWAAEMLAGGDPAAGSGWYHATAGLVFWIAFWLLFVHEDRVVDRGPWLLALLPVVLVVPLVLARPLAPTGGVSVASSGLGPLAGLIVAAYVIGLALYWYLRRRA